jgi:hypothetical protein
MTDDDPMRDVDSLCDGFHLNPHLNITPTPDDEWHVSAPWTSFAARGETELGALHAFIEGYKERLMASRAERDAVVTYMKDNGYEGIERDRAG